MNDSSIKVKGRRRWLRVFVVITVLILLTVLTFGIWLKSALEASLPLLDGSWVGPGIEAEVVIERDDQGIPTIHATNLADAYFAEGFLHGQDRFFQIDLCPRFSAGELAALVGVAGTNFDLKKRPLGYRQISRRLVASLTAEQKKIFGAYVAGVNAGMRALQEVPPEYLVLNQEPQPWHRFE